MYPETLRLIEEKRQAGVFPGAVFSFIEDDREENHVLGNSQVEPEEILMHEDFLFDVASLTKVVCTTTMLLKLKEAGQLFWDQSLHEILPEFQDESITLRHLLTHTSDIKTYIPQRDQLNAEELRAAYLTLQPGDQLGKIVQYTDAGTILLGFLLEKYYQKDTVAVFKEEVLQPLGMTDSLFLPQAPYDKIVPTQKLADGTILKGKTHDPKARVLAAHAGNAGLFTTVKDLSKFAKMYLNLGHIKDMIYLKEETIRELLDDQTPSGKGKRSIGWDLKFSPLDQSVLLFHTGYTGTFLVLDIIKQSAFIFLSNRVHPSDHRASYVIQRDEILASYLQERATRYQK
ncbi:serine hydrolase [Enterococcus dongliensis]|uniref:Serine hydrolase n=1 Tax=Enterococcus dongliensis TaxID=2559925 RepID=A0AAP5KNF0_9ENTE|nr:serine hydrolase domain-containing protein [Enterococcus dongliensis]MDT2595585.1 serine hydrolase [Enterococcus dongliensis]MDT2603199.1 serine hydrolase [Enterococcus dongliensis]MDT2633562.1 serine hydrolase [Enterococcus dongliensis]MDT2636064.1 serine hydrolase [Enterococcus dongliensis]MDT2639030.1 serine hydrolase [Enterococcus dongliensis]